MRLRPAFCEHPARCAALLPPAFLGGARCRGDRPGIEHLRRREPHQRPRILGRSHQPLVSQLGQRIACRRPEDVAIDVKVGMREPIPHAYDGGPRNLGQQSAPFGRDLSRRLAHDLDGTNERKQQHFIAIEVGAIAPPCEAQRRVDRVEHVLQPYKIIPLHTALGPRVPPGL